jgi:hypothetical protein
LKLIKSSVKRKKRIMLITYKKILSIMYDNLLLSPIN